MNISIKEETLGQRIRAARIRMGWTQEMLADKMCVPKSTISAYENDKVDIKSSVIVELSKLLDTTPNYLLGMKEECCDEESILLIHQIKDKKIRDMLLVQIRALVANQ